MSLILSTAELRTLTERQHRDSQQRVLRALGVPFRLDGSRIIVSRAAFEAAMLDRTTPEAANEAYSVDFAALRSLGRGKATAAR